MGRAAPGWGRSRACRRCRATARSRPAAAGWPRPGSGGAGSSRGRRSARDGASGVSTPPAGLSVNENALKIGWIARVVAVGVVVGRADAEVAQPARDLGRVRADELQHGLEALERLRAVAERRASRRAGAPGSFRVASTRSLSGPGRRTSSRRSWIVGRASSTSGRSSRRNGASSRVAGLDSATSTSRSSSVARRFTNVVLARRSVVGSRPSASASATFSEPIAPGGRVRVADERGEVVALLGERAGEPSTCR